MRRAALLALVVLAACSKGERTSLAEKFASDACACKDSACARAADKAYDRATCGSGKAPLAWICSNDAKGVLVPPPSREEKAVEAAELRGNQCIEALAPPGQACGGNKNLKCPDGLTCVLPKVKPMAEEWDPSGTCRPAGY